jgi:hypothetical protein
MLIHEGPLYQVTVGVWCAMSATTIIGLSVFEATNSLLCTTDILVTFFKIFPITEETMDFKTQNHDSRTKDIMNEKEFKMNCLQFH